MTTFTEDRVETALCIWEAMLESRPGLPEMTDAWGYAGTCEMRRKAIRMAHEVDGLWLTLTEDEREALTPFDWEYVVAFVHVWWTDHEAGTPESRAKRVKTLAEREVDRVELVIAAMNTN